MSVIYTSSAAVFECKAKACAPPPVGSGGSTGGSSGATPPTLPRGSAPRASRTAVLSIKNGSAYADGQRLTTKITKLGRTWHAKMLGKGGTTVNGNSRMDVAREAAVISRYRPDLMLRPPTIPGGRADRTGEASTQTGVRHWINSNPQQSRRQAERLRLETTGPGQPKLDSDGSVTYQTVTGKSRTVTHKEVSGVHPVDLFNSLNGRSDDMDPAPRQIVKHLTGWTVDYGGEGGTSRAYRDTASGTEFLPERNFSN